MLKNKKTDIEIIKKIVKHCNHINTDVNAMGTYEVFENDYVYQRASSQSLQQISELAKGLSDAAINRSKEINWKGLKGFRTFVAHEYEALDWSIVWDLMTVKVPMLKQSCERLIEELRN
jgi:uncharacterized protein with HEPN domain